MNIKDAAAASGLPVKTIRYYEESGLISPARAANGYRRFSEKELHRLSFLARARALGFSLDECRELLALYDDQSRASADVKRIARAHLAQIDRKMAELREMRETLSHLVAHCKGDERPDRPIIDGLAEPLQ